MNRLDRLAALLIHLQTKRVVRAQELADRFGISLRTVYRDVRALEVAGVPIGAEAGIGYFLENYHLPPVQLTNAEASALLFGGKLIEKWTDPALQREAESALFKIKSVLKRPEQDHLADLDARVRIFRTPTAPALSTGLLPLLQRAVVEQNVMRLSYFSSYNAADTERDVEPLGLFQYGQGWHLIGYCRLRQDYRDFRVERIRHADPTNESFKRRPDFSLEAYVGHLYLGENLTECVVVVDNSVVRFLIEVKYAFGFQSEEAVGEGVRMVFRTLSVEAFGRWLLSYTDSVRVESPPALLDWMQRLAGEVQRAYGRGERIE